MKRLLLGLFLGPLAYGQQTTAAKILNAVTGPGASGAVENVQQGAHQVALFVSSTGAGTCSGTAQFEYSFDNTTWVAFPAPPAVQSFSFLFQSATTQTYSFFGSGTFPFVRFNLTAFTSSITTCSATAWYQGSPGGSGSIQTVGQAGVTVQPVVNYQSVGGLSPSIPNSGQTFHQLWASLASIGGQTCATTDNYTLTLQGAGPSSQIAVIINVLIPGSGNAGFTAAIGPILGSGAYQSLTLSATQGGSAGTHCILNVWYSGSFAGSLPAVSSHLPGTGGTNSVAYPVPITQCGLSANVAVTAASTSVIVTGPGIVTAANVRVCQLVMTTPTAAAIATVSSAAHGGACASPTTLGTFNMAVGVPVTLGGGLGNVISLEAGRDLCLGATTGNVNGIVSYDYQ